MRRMTKEEYLRTHLLDMDEATKRWYINAMETWTSADYDRYTRFMIDMLGEPTEEQLERLKKIAKAIKDKERD